MLALSPLQFLPALTQLGGYPVETKRFVDAFFRFSSKVFVRNLVMGEDAADAGCLCLRNRNLPMRWRRRSRKDAAAFSGDFCPPLLPLTIESPLT